jgi:hypothetical protein
LVKEIHQKNKHTKLGLVYINYTALEKKAFNPRLLSLFVWYNRKKREKSRRREVLSANRSGSLC